MRRFEGRLVADFCFVEDNEVGRKTLADLAAVAEVESLGGKGSHFADRVFKRNYFQFADIFAEHAGVVSVTTRMRDARTELPHTAVRRDHRKRLPHDRLDVVLAHHAIDHLSAALVVHIEHLFDLCVNLFLSLDHLRDLGDVLSVEVRVCPVAGDVCKAEILELLFLEVGLHFFKDLLTNLRVGQPLSALFTAAGDGPTRQAGIERGGRSGVGILVDGHRQPACRVRL